MRTLVKKIENGSIVLDKHSVEKALNKSLVSDKLCLGLDIARKTGWCQILVTDDKVFLEYGVFEIENIELMSFLRSYIDFFKNLLKTLNKRGIDYDKIVIEDTFYGKNVKGFQLLTRLGMIPFVLSYIYKIGKCSFLLATQARKKLGLISNKNKKETQLQFKTLIPELNIDSEDIIDAIILAMGAVAEDPQSHLE